MEYLTKIPLPHRPQKAPIHQLPHDAKAVVKFESATLSSSFKANMAFLYAFFIAIMALIYMSYPSELTAGLVISTVIAVTLAVYRFVYGRR